MDNAREEFWRLADTERLSAEYGADRKLEWLSSAPVDALLDVCRQYRFFTESYPADLGLLVGRVPFGRLKSLLAEVLSEELGSGRPEEAHLELWDSFLRSLGVPSDAIPAAPEPRNALLLSAMRRSMLEETTAFTIGLRGMGGECLCQVYLTAMHEHLRRHPYVRANAETIDWRFWRIHVGEADISHRETVRAAVSEYMDLHPDSVEPLCAGYLAGKSTFDQFWENVYSSHCSSLRST